MLVTASDLKIKPVSEKDNIGVFSFGPLPTGFGHTLGNSLRRVLLSSIKGSAITQLKIAGTKHQFSTVPGVKEDVVELCLNFKQIRFVSHVDQPVVATIEKTGPGVVTAADIKCPSDIEVVNKKLHIATLADKKSVFNVELVVGVGFGYLPTEDQENFKLGVIPLDALFSPVVRATYSVEPMRFGKTTDLDELILTVETDGSILPSKAVLEAAALLQTFFDRILVWEDTSVEDVSTEKEVSGNNTLLENVLVDELPLPTRTINALKKHGIENLRELAAKDIDDLADIKNLGEKSIQEITKLLKKEGLYS